MTGVQSEVHRELRGLNRAAQMMWLFAVLILAGGFTAAVVLVTGPDPYVIEGVAVAVGGSFVATVLIFVANWAAAWAAVQRQRGG